jgi:hypothetical protein
VSDNVGRRFETDIHTYFNHVTGEADLNIQEVASYLIQDSSVVKLTWLIKFRRVKGIY